MEFQIVRLFAARCNRDRTNLRSHRNAVGVTNRASSARIKKHQSILHLVSPKRYRQHMERKDNHQHVRDMTRIKVTYLCLPFTS